MIVNLSRRAEADLVEIATWIAQDDPIRASTFARELRQACEQLETFPLAYPTMPTFGPNARRKNHGPYAIIYDVLDIEVLVLTIVHGARNLDAFS